MAAAERKWMDGLRDHFYSWGRTNKSEMAEYAGVSDTAIGDWLRSDDYPTGMQERSIKALCTALRVSSEELRILERIEPRGPEPVETHARADQHRDDSAGAIDWSQVDLDAIPQHIVISWLARNGWSEHLIKEGLRQMSERDPGRAAAPAE